MASLVTKRCRQCKYSMKLNGNTYLNDGEIFCNYLCETGTQRECPAGDECIRFVKKSKKDKRKLY